MRLALLLALAAAPATATSSTMRRVTAPAACGTPFTSCVNLEQVPIPQPGEGHALVAIAGTSVNPSDCDTVEAGQCGTGCGADLSGVVVSCPGCHSIRAGDRVWGLAEGAYADYIVAPESSIGLAPNTTDDHSLAAAASIPEVGLTSLLSLLRTAYAPGTDIPSSFEASSFFKNKTVVVTSGAGGTGAAAIQIAKAWGATSIVVAATGPGVAFAKGLGATRVVDYRTEGEILDAIEDGSADIVYDNYGASGSADKAQSKLRAGGVYLLLPHGACYETKSQKPPCLSAHPRAGTHQYNYATGADFDKYARQGLDVLAGMVDANSLKVTIDKTFTLSSIALAFNYSAGPGSGGVGSHTGKISVDVAGGRANACTWVVDQDWESPVNNSVHPGSHLSKEQCCDMCKGTPWCVLSVLAGPAGSPPGACWMKAAGGKKLYRKGDITCNYDK